MNTVDDLSKCPHREAYHTIAGEIYCPRCRRFVDLLTPGVSAAVLDRISKQLTKMASRAGIAQRRGK